MIVFSWILIPLSGTGFWILVCREPAPLAGIRVFLGLMKIIFLGTGTSHGVPTIDCMIEEYARCKKDVCRQSERDPKHARTRTSILIEREGKAICIDASLDFRQQALREKVKRIDALFVTHCHVDHTGGIPDVRSYTRHAGKALPLYGSEESVRAIRKSYSYIFDPCTFQGGGIPNVETRVVTAPFELFGNQVIPISVRHGDLQGCFGYRLGPLVYIPDMKSIEDGELRKCTGAEVLILNCLRDEREHISHLILPESIALARRINPRRCYFIHMCHDIHYEFDGAGLDEWMHFSYDGLRIEIQ
jgi:phosphoribosyl 1,2-cyclic phosphate phosphodiesterase